ncbi:MAG: hypothetical protein AAGI03_06200 [Pseudomonadota bacterium]
MSDIVTFGFCAWCERSVHNPCRPTAEVEATAPAIFPAAPYDPNKPIVAKSREALLTRVHACSVGRWIHRMGFSRTEVRCYVHYRVEKGRPNGVNYEWSNNDPLNVTFEMIEEAFDGRPQRDPDPDGPDWRDDPGSYDRAISDLVRRAVAGEIKAKPDSRWFMRFLLIDISRRTPIYDVSDDN